MIFALLLLVAEGAAASVPSWLPSPAMIAKTCEVYAPGPPRQWCVRQASEKAEQARLSWAATEAEKRRQVDAARAAFEARQAAARQAQSTITPPIAEEAKAAARAAADADAAAVAATPLPTPVEMQFAWSAKICDRQAERAESIAAIKKEHRYSKIGGVVHLDRLGELQDEVASADEDIAEFRSQLRELGKPALSCKYVAAHRE